MYFPHCARSLTLREGVPLGSSLPYIDSNVKILTPTLAYPFGKYEFNVLCGIQQISVNEQNLTAFVIPMGLEPITYSFMPLYVTIAKH